MGNRALQTLEQSHRALRGLRGRTDEEYAAIGRQMTDLERAIAAAPAAGIPDCLVKLRLQGWLLRDGCGCGHVVIALGAGTIVMLERLAQGRP